MGLLAFLAQTLSLLPAVAALLLGGVQTSLAATFEVTEVDCMASPGGWKWAVEQANANPGRDTIQIRTDFSPGNCPRRPTEQYPDFHVTQSVDIVGNGFYVLDDPMWVDANGQVNPLGSCPNSSFDKMISDGSGFIDIGQRNTDNTGVEVTINGLNMRNLFGVAIVRKGAKLTIENAYIHDVYSIFTFSQCITPIIEAQEKVDLTLRNVRFSMMTLTTDAYMSTEFPVSTAFIDGGLGGGNLVMDGVLMEGFVGNHATAIRWVDGTVKIVNSQMVNSHGIWLNNVTMDFVNSTYVASPAGMGFNDNFLIDKSNVKFQASTFWWGLTGDPCDRTKPGYQCAPKVTGFYAEHPADFPVENSGSNIRFESSAIGSQATFSWAALMGDPIQFTSDAMTWFQPRAEQNAAAITAILPNALTALPGLPDFPSFSSNEYFWDITPLVPGTLIEAVPNAGSGGANELKSPTAVVAYTDDFNRANSDWGAASGGWVDTYSGIRFNNNALEVKYGLGDSINYFIGWAGRDTSLNRPASEASIYNKIEADIYISEPSSHGFLLRLNGSERATLSALAIWIRKNAGISYVNVVYWDGGWVNPQANEGAISGGLTVGQWYKVTAEISGSNPAAWSLSIKNSSNTTVYSASGNLSAATYPKLQGTGTVGIAPIDSLGIGIYDNITIWKDITPVAPSAPSIILHSDPEIPANNPLLALIENMPEQSWLKVNTNLVSAAWTPYNKSLTGENDNQSSVIGAWSSFAWDTENGGIIMFGGGHANTGSNAVLLWDSATLQWRVGSLPTKIEYHPEITDQTWLTVDPDSPQSSHCYDNNLFLTLSKRFLTFGGSVYMQTGIFRRLRDGVLVNAGPFFFDPAKADANKVGGVTGSGVDPNDLGSGAWQNRDIWYNLPTQALTTNNFLAGTTDTYIEDGKDVVLFQNYSGIYKYTINSVDTLTTDTITHVAGPPYWGEQGAGAYNPYSKLYVKTGSPTLFSYWDLRDSLVGPNNPIHNFNPDVNNVGANISIQDVNATGFEFDPVRNQFYLNKGGDFVYTLREPRNADGWIFDIDNPTATTGPGNGSANETTNLSGGILGKWKKAKGKNGSPGFDVFVLLKEPTQGSVWIYKPKNWVNPKTYNTVDTITVSVPSTPGTYPNNGYALYVASSEEGLATAPIAATISASESLFKHAKAIGQTPNYYAVRAFDNQGTALYSSFSNVVPYAFVNMKQLHGIDMHGIDNLPILKDALGNPRVYGNNTRNIGAVQNADAPVLKATGGDSKVDLGWNKPTGTITGYEICTSTSVLTDPFVGNCTGTSTLVNDPTQTAQTIASLTNGSPYWFVIRSYNDSTPGIWSNVATATPLATVGIPVVTGTPGVNQVQLFWTEPATGGHPGPVSYFVTYRVKGQTQWIAGPGNLSGRITTIPGLTGGTEYEFGVAARTFDGATAPVVGTTTATPINSCDVNSDGSVNKTDIGLINAARNKPSSGTSDLRDLNSDGVINLYDSRQCMLLCTKPLCAL